MIVVPFRSFNELACGQSGKRLSCLCGKVTDLFYEWVPCENVHGTRYVNGNKGCTGLPWTLKRYLFYFEIANCSHKCSNRQISSSQHSIPTRVSTSKTTIHVNDQDRSTQLLNIKFCNVSMKAKKYMPFSRQTPFLILSNMRFLQNKLDEVAKKLSRFMTGWHFSWFCCHYSQLQYCQERLQPLQRW